MPYILNDQKPALPFRFFEEIAAIPRASGHEQGIANYLVRFATAHGLECYRDAMHNVLIKKPATKGREHEAPVLLQAHSDMVAEKNKGCAHDFSSEGIRLVREGNILRADGTTLGADDGGGMAIMLAAICEASSHPPLECLFTVSEEIGLLGASAFDYSRISARRMLNLDSAEEGVITTGCCGGKRSDVVLPVQREPITAEGIAICVKGLCGGHSGEDIHKGRGNALQWMASLIGAVQEKMEVRLSDIHGGDKDNAIPRECEAVIFVPNARSAMQILEAQAQRLKACCTAPEDAGACCTFARVTLKGMLSAQDTERLLQIMRVPNGVLAFREDGVLPQTSRNMASIATAEGEVQLTFSTRSPMSEEIEKHCLELLACAEANGAHVTHRGAYPGWESPADSATVRAWQDAYHRVSGKRAETAVIHAGLECGIICDRVPSLEAISVGCNIFDLHTPAERMELDSFACIYQTVLEYLKEC